MNEIFFWFIFVNNLDFFNFLQNKKKNLKLNTLIKKLRAKPFY